MGNGVKVTLRVLCWQALPKGFDKLVCSSEVYVIRDCGVLGGDFIVNRIEVRCRQMTESNRRTRG